MDCPFCKIATMRKVVSGEKEIDRCLACGALWFDYGEIRELVEGHLPVEEEEAREEPPGAALRRLHRQAPSLFCPRCGGQVGAIDFQTTGIGLFRCRACNGFLAPRRSAAGISARFRFLREHGEEFARLGETLAGAMRRRMEREHGPVVRAAEVPIPLPVVVPLADDGPGVRSFPIITYLLIGLSLGVYAFARMSDTAPALPGGLPGLPPGAGFANVSPIDLLFSLFLHAGLLPLLAGSLFLFVLGDNVEDRMGWLPYLAFFLLCGIAAGAAHVLWGGPGESAALGSAGAVAGVLGAYLVFFPDVSIEMFGLGRVVTVPAYLFACTWVAAAFLIGPGPYADFLNPAPLSLAGNLAGFATGVGAGILWRVAEDRRMIPRNDT